MTTLQRMTYADLMALPDDDMLHELVRGEIIERIYRADSTTALVPLGGVLDGEDVLPGFSLNLGELFG